MHVVRRITKVVAPLVLGSVALAGCWLPGGPPPTPSAELQLVITPFPASNPCTLGCTASTTVTVTNIGDAATTTGVDLTVVADAPSTGLVFPLPPTACSSTNVLDPGESCTGALTVGRLAPGPGGLDIPDPGVASGQVTATSGSDFENQLYSVTLGGV